MVDLNDAKFVDVSGINTRYFEAGEGEPMLLVHGGQFGGGASAEDWFLNFDDLAESFHVYALDKIGQGYSDAPKADEDYVIGSAVQHSIGFMETLNIDKAHIVGHSRGGYLAARVALERPEMVRSIVIVDSATLMQPITFYKDLAASMPHFDDPMEMSKRSTAANSYGTAHITDDWTEGKLKIDALPSCQEASAKNAELEDQFDENLLAMQKDTHAWIRAGGLGCPTLVVWGLEDPSAVWDPIGLDCLNLILPNVADSQMHIFNHSGHYPFREHPDEFGGMVRAFIATSGKAVPLTDQMD